MKKNFTLIIISFVLVLVSSFRCFAQLGEDTVYHYYKAIVPFRTEDIEKVGALEWYGVECYDFDTHTFHLSFSGDDRDWMATFCLGAIENTGDARYKDLICVFKQKFVREKFGPIIIGSMYRFGGKSCISCNQKSYNKDALVDMDYCTFEEITEKEYYSYLPRNGVKKSDTNKEEIYLYEDNIEKSGWYKDGEGSRYFDPATGKAVYGWQLIEGDWYYFMPGTYYMVRNKYIDGYYLNNKGKCTNYNGVNDTNDIEVLETAASITNSQNNVRVEILASNITNTSFSSIDIQKLLDVFSEHYVIKETSLDTIKVNNDVLSVIYDYTDKSGNALTSYNKLVFTNGSLLWYKYITSQGAIDEGNAIWTQVKSGIS